MVQSYNRHPHSCFFYVGSLLGDEFGVMPAQAAALSQMLIVCLCSYEFLYLLLAMEASQ